MTAEQARQVDPPGACTREDGLERAPIETMAGSERQPQWLHHAALKDAQEFKPKIA